MKTWRIRDPLHNLIEFSESSELERTLWKVIDARPFQRLRRVKQLGFSDFVYPGASHSRFAHSLGVFHTARQLMAVVRRHGSAPVPSKEERALAAALVHDLGHGPFSHAFENVGERLGLKLANHEDMSDLLIRNGEVAGILNEMGGGFANDVADIIQKGGVKTVHHAVVSSQFDADRLDYMQRDRLMTGARHAAIDFSWLVANLEIATVATGVENEGLKSIDTFVLGPKAIYAAEAFVLGLFQLYPMVYFHKTTRGIEKIFTELIVRIFILARDGDVKATGLSNTHPLVSFARSPEDIETALALDDTVVWGALSQCSDASDPLVGSFSKRIRDRKIFKCYDIRTEAAQAIDPSCHHSTEHMDKIDRCCAKIDEKLTDWIDEQQWTSPLILLDKAERSPYKSIGESKGPLDRINIKNGDGSLVDLKQMSRTVAALQNFKLFRAYIDADATTARESAERIVTGEIEKWRTRTP